MMRKMTVVSIVGEIRVADEIEILCKLWRWENLVFVTHSPHQFRVVGGAESASCERYRTTKNKYGEMKREIIIACNGRWTS